MIVLMVGCSLRSALRGVRVERGILSCCVCLNNGHVSGRSLLLQSAPYNRVDARVRSVEDGIRVTLKGRSAEKYAFLQM